jgi:SAM-dependent methyltransferase
MTPIESTLRELAELQANESGEHQDWGQGYFDTHRAYYRGVVGLVDEHLDAPLLELGAAPYHLTYLLDQQGYTVTAVDIAPERMNAIHAAGDFDLVGCDIEAESLPFETNSMPGILLTEVVEHLRINPLHTLREIRRVLRPDGRLLLTTPNLLSIYNLESLLTTGTVVDPAKQYRKLETIGHMGHVTEYTPAEVRSLLFETGFDIVHSDLRNWPEGRWRDRTLKHNLGLALSAALPQLRKFQIHVATPATPPIKRAKYEEYP